MPPLFCGKMSFERFHVPSFALPPCCVKRGTNTEPSLADSHVWYLVEPTLSHSLAAIARPELMPSHVPLKSRGRREGRVPARTRGPRASKVARGRTTGVAGSSDLPCAMVLTAYFVLSPVPGLCCHRRPQIESANLTPASGRQDHTTSPSARNVIRLLTCRVHRIPSPASVTIAKRPFCVGRDGRG